MRLEDRLLIISQADYIVKKLARFLARILVCHKKLRTGTDQAQLFEPQSRAPNVVCHLAIHSRSSELPNNESGQRSLAAQESCSSAGSSYWRGNLCRCTRSPSLGAGMCQVSDGPSPEWWSWLRFDQAAACEQGCQAEIASIISRIDADSGRWGSARHPPCDLVSEACPTPELEHRHPRFDNCRFKMPGEGEKMGAL